MSDYSQFSINDRWIESLRGSKNLVDKHKPYAWLVEKERTKTARTEDVGIIFLTNKECPYRCLMCDLWKNTADESVGAGSIPEQVEWALKMMPGVKHVKLYNNGSFFDEQAIPSSDYEKIALLLDDLETVIVECHPRLVGEKCVRFSDMLKPELEVALGLETVNPDVLKKLNKKMTTEDFSKAVRFLKKNGISSRTFILLRPPFLSEAEGVDWAMRSIDFAFGSGAECCTVIPVRGGNGAMERLQEDGLFSPPGIRSLEAVLEYGIKLKSGRVFADVWDLAKFSECPDCLDRRRERLIFMNLNQEIPLPVECGCTHTT